MADVQFNEPPGSVKASPRPKGITAFLIHTGFAKDERGANRVQLAIAIIALALTAFLWVSGFSSGQSTGITPEERARIEAMP